METFETIKMRFQRQGLRLELYKSEDENALYNIFQNVVDSGNQFPYECNSLAEFHRQFLNEQSKVYTCHNNEGKIVGGFYVRTNFASKSKHIANAAYMVDEKERGQGIGKLLVTASLYIAKELGFRAIQFNMVSSQNLIAVELYKKLGFEITEILTNGFKNKQKLFHDGYVMYRSLEDL